MKKEMKCRFLLFFNLVVVLSTSNFQDTPTSWFDRSYASSLPCYEDFPNGPNGDKLPSRLPSRFTSFSEVEHIIDDAILQQHERLFIESNWILDGHFGVERARIALERKSKDTIQEENKIALPFVQRVLLPKGSIVAVFGDLHGSYHSFIRSLNSLVEQGYLDNNLKVKVSNFFMLFLGDYVDRGLYGLETLCALLELRLTNLDRVFLARGNHEDRLMNDGPSGGFLDELRSKFPDEPYHRIEKVFDVYDSLPSAIFLGVSDEKSQNNQKKYHPVLLCCHGGLEVGFEALPLVHAEVRSSDALPSGAISHFALIHGLYRGQWLESLPEHLFKKVKHGISSPERIFKNMGACPARESLDGLEGLGSIKNPFNWESNEWPLQPTDVHPHLGFMWADFLVGDERILGQSEWNVGKAAALGKAVVNQHGRGLAFGRELTEHWLQSSGIVGVLRAHQHNDAAETGPMLRSLKLSTSPGIFDNFNASHNVITFLSGAFIPGQGFQFDAYGLLRLVNDDTSSWSLEACASSRIDSPFCSTSGGEFKCKMTDWTVNDAVKKRNKFSEQLLCSRKDNHGEL